MISRRDFLKLSTVAAALPLLPAYRPRAVHVVDPSTFEATFAAAVKGDTLILTDGIYPITLPVLETRCNLIADRGARPVLVRTNGYTPSILCYEDTIIDGLWFGGARDETTERGVVQFRQRVLFRNNVLWNYYGGMNDGGGGMSNMFRRNVLVNCGTAFKHHPLYVNNSNPLHTAYVVGNLFIGGQGWHIHLWGGPTNTLVDGNFSADADYCLAFQGSNNICSNNVWWKPTSPGYPINVANSGPLANNIYRRNFHGQIVQASPVGSHMDWFGAWNWDGRGVTASNNHYINPPKSQEADKNPVNVPPGSEATYLGKTAAEIDAAVNALKAAFTGTPQQVHDDTTIAGHVAVLQSVINKWAGQ
jgi:hypothetical protein